MTPLNLLTLGCELVKERFIDGFNEMRKLLELVSSLIKYIVRRVCNYTLRENKPFVCPFALQMYPAKKIKTNLGSTKKNNFRIICHKNISQDMEVLKMNKSI